MNRPDILPAPGPREELYVPYPEQTGLTNFFINVRASDKFPGGIADGMTLAVAEPIQHEGETVEETWNRIGAQHADLENRPDYAVNPGPLDKAFYREHWNELPESEPIIAPPEERTIAGMSHHIQKVVAQNEQYIPEDTPTHVGLRAPHTGSGGRYSRPMWGWDTHFDTVGDLAMGNRQRVRNAAENVAALVDRTGTLANSGLRVIADRPHLPFDGHTYQKLAEIEGPQVLVEFLPAMVKSWSTWTAGRVSLAELPQGAIGRSGFSFLMDDGLYLEGVGSTGATPRPEMYKEDVELAHMRAQAKNLKGEAYQAEMRAFYDNVRGGALMGNDFHGGQLADGQNLYTINTVGRISVPINSLLAYNEFLIAQAYEMSHEPALARFFHSSAMQRMLGMDRHLFNQETKTYQDRYEDGSWAEPDANMAYPLYTGIAPPDKIDGVREALEDYVQKGGVVTTLNRSRQSWGAMTDWAMTSYVVDRGLARAGHALSGGPEGALALKLAERAHNAFLIGSLVHYQTTGQIGERVNALDPASPHETDNTGEYASIGNFPTRGLVYEGLRRSHPYDRTGGALPFGFLIREEVQYLN